MYKFLTKKYSILSLALGVVCSLSAAEASKREGDFLKREDEKGKTRRIESSDFLEAEDNAAHRHSITWEELNHKINHSPEEIKNHSELQNKVLAYYFETYAPFKPSFLATLIPDLERNASSDAKALWLLLKSELEVSGSISENTAALIKALKGKEDPNSLLVLSNCYNKGWSLKQDTQKGLKILKFLAEQGNIVAQCSLGGIYFNGTGGVEKNQAVGVKWYLKAAEQGNVVAQCSLGGIYFNGTGGVEKNQAVGVKWFRKAAEQGYAAGQYALGRAYFEGAGVEPDRAVSVKLYHKAAEQGYAAGQYGLGIAYFFGMGVKQDIPVGVEWYHKAADQGLNIAQFNLALLYFEKDEYKDFNAAFWYSLLSINFDYCKHINNTIKNTFEIALISPREDKDVEFIYSLEDSPLSSFESLSTRLAMLSRRCHGTLKGDQEMISPSRLPLSQLENLPCLYQNVNDIQKILAETLPQALSNPGFLITNLTFTPAFNPVCNPYMSRLDIKGQDYVCLGLDNVKGVNNIFISFMRTAEQTETIIDTMMVELNAGLKTLIALEEESDKINALKIYYQSTARTLEDLKTFTQNSRHFLEETLIASTPQRNKIFAEKFGHCLT